MEKTTENKLETGGAQGFMFKDLNLYFVHFLGVDRGKESISCIGAR